LEYKNHYENKIVTKENQKNGPDSDAKRVLSRYDVTRPAVADGEDPLLDTEVQMQVLLNNQSLTACKRQSFSLVVGQGANHTAL
jgi:hypothetical protein